MFKVPIVHRREQVSRLTPQKNLIRLLLICQVIFSAVLSVSVQAQDYSFVTKWGSANSGDVQFQSPGGIAVDSSGNVYVADTGNHRIQKLTADGQFITQWGSFGSGDGQFWSPRGIAVDSSGNLYVVDSGSIDVPSMVDSSNPSIQKFSTNGQFMAKWGSDGSGDGQFRNPSGIAVDSSGNLYVADRSNHRIQKLTANGQFITQWGSQGSGDGQFSYPEGIALDSNGNLYVLDTGNNRIQKLTANGQFITQWGSEGSGDGQFRWPSGIAVDSSGNLYVADRGNHRIQKFPTNGQFITQWGSEGSGDGQFRWPLGIAVDNSGNVYVADSLNNRIQKFAPANNRLTNISVRCPIGAGGATNRHNQVVAGFVVSGSAAKRVLIRAQDSALTDGAQDARLTLYALSSGTPQVIDSNSSWQQHASASQISQLSANLIPPNSTDAAMLVSLNPGVYTAEAYGNNFVGTVSLEDLDAASVDSRLMNLSGRCLVETSPRNAVVGFVVSGDDAATSLKLLVRSITSGLTQQPSIFDPRMTLYRLNLTNGSAQVLDTVDNWSSHSSASCVSGLSANLVPSSVRDVAFCVNLAPGVYTGEVAANIADVATTAVDVLP